MTPALQEEIAQRKAAILGFLHQAKAAAHARLPTIQPVPRDGLLPLSFAQQRLWFLEQLQPDSAAYNVALACRLTTETLNVAVLVQSLNEIIGRHEALRTTFATVDGRPLQAIAPRLALPLPVVDLRGIPTTARQAEVQRLATAEAQRPFDLAHGPLLRTTLLWLDEAEHLLLLTAHHIIWDGWSSRLFFREIATFYEAFAAGQHPALPALPIQYADFAHWQRTWLQGEVLETQLAYWRRQLDGAPMVLELLTDRPRSAVQTFRGGQQSLALSQSLSESLKALSRQEDVTLFMSLLAAFNVLLHRYTGQDDILVGSSIAGRGRPETEMLIGFFINALVLRTDLSGNPTFRQLLHRVREVALEAYSHQDLPFELLVEALRPERDLSRTPLFQVFFNMHNFAESLIELHGLTIETLPPHEPAAKFDLLLYVREQHKEILLVSVYNADLFEDATIARMLEHFQTLLEGIAVDPARQLSKLPFLTASQRQHLSACGNLVRPDHPFIKFSKEAIEQSIPSRFEQQVKQYPHKVAIKTKNDAWTYSTLNTLANRVARAILTVRGSGEERIALLFEHDAPMIASILGVLKAGKTYVPLDPLSPQERLTYYLHDLQASALLTHNSHLALAQALAEDTLQIINVDVIESSESSDNIDRLISPDVVAYILYTSGSTGQPKGVMQNHRNILFFIGMYTNSLHLSAADRLTLLAHYGFDAAVMDIFAALLNGATLYPYDLRTQDLTQLGAWLQREAITIYHSTPTVYRHFVRTLTATECLPAMRLLVLGGEPLYKGDVDLYKQHFPQDCVLVNGFGPTESTLALQYCIGQHTEVRRHSVPLGYPVEGIEILVLNDGNEPVEGYGIGEIVIRSPHIALGYWRQPTFTSMVFGPDPTGGHRRVYRTGDLGRWLPDGSLAFAGRKDWQVKVRGYRVELGEIETTLCAHPAIQEAVVMAQEEGPGEVCLVAYVVPRQTAVPTSSELRHWLRQKLPAYMLPAAFVRLDALPLTSTGKVDRRALPVVGQNQLALAAAFVAPRTPTEEVLAGIWATVLGIEHVGVHDNFFDLGGHSLMAVQVMSRLRGALQVEVPVRALFEAPTVANLALYVETTRQAAPDVPEPPIRPVPRQGAVPVSVAQEHLWVLDQVLPGTPFFTMLYAMRLLGPLNVAVLEHSINEIVRRHEVLRTTFALVDRQPVQVIAPSLSVPLTVGDLRALPETERQGEAQRLARAEARQPFDLAQGPLLRVQALRLGEQEHLLFVSMHHIISDGWSLGVLTHELAVLYDAFAAGGPSPLPALPIQYGDFAQWQRQWQHSEARQAQLAYWQQQLRPPLPVLALLTDRSRAGALSFRTARQSLVIPEALSAALAHLSRREGSTLFMLLLAAFKVLLHNYTGQADLRVGTLVANRNRQETEGLIGLFTNIVILRTDLGGNPTFREVLQRVRDITLAAYAHDGLPCAELVQTFEHAHTGERTALCQVMFILQNAMQRPLHLPARMLTFVEADEYMVAPEVTAITCDIILVLRVRSQGLTVSCLYKASLFDTTTINQMLEDFQHVLTRIIAQPEQPLSTFGSLRDKCG